MAKKSRNAAPPPFLAGPQRLNKVLAAAGLGARRQVEELIEQGRVEVDGKVVSEFHVKVDPAVSKISVDGQSLRKQRPVYFAVNKPAGVLCTNRDPEGRPRVIDLVPDSARLFPVGRLDRSSVGLILLTNDGELSQRLAHPKYGVDKTYFVVVQGQIGNDQLARLRRGIYLAEGVARVEGAKIRRFRKGCTELEICLTEGKNREIRRVLARLGHKVMVLRRLGIGPLRLANLAEGMYRPLTNEEVAALYAAAERARIARRDQKKGRNSTKADEPVKSGESKAAKVGSKGTRKPKKTKTDDEEILNDIEQSLMDVDDWNEDDDLVLPVDGVSGFEEDESDDFDEELDDESIVEVSPVWNEQETYSQSEGGVIEYDDEEAEEAGLMRPARKRRDDSDGAEDRPRKTGRKVGRKPIRGSRNQERGENAIERIEIAVKVQLHASSAKELDPKAFRRPVNEVQRDRASRNREPSKSRPRE